MRGHPGPQHSLNAAHPTAFRVPPRLSRGSPDEVSGEPFQAEPVSWSEKSSSSLTPQESLPDTMIVLQRSVSPTSSGHPFSWGRWRVGHRKGDLERSPLRSGWLGKGELPRTETSACQQGALSPRVGAGSTQRPFWVPSALNPE